MSKINYFYREIVNPIIEITCCDKKKYSATKKDIGPTSTVTWAEHLFFEPKNMVKYNFNIFL